MILKIDNKDIYYKWVNQQYLSDTCPVMIFLHDGLGSVAQWKDFPEEISKKLQVPALLYDRIGHGKSTAHKEIRTIRYLEDEGKDFLPRVIQQLGLKQPLIIYGHSDGGTIALIYAASFPENVLAVISEAAHVFNEPETRNGILKMIGEYEAGDLPVKLQKFHGEKTRTMFYAWAMPWLTPRAEKWNIFNYLNDIQADILLIQGMHDPYATIKQVKEIKSRLKEKAVTLQLDQCGHFPHTEHKELVIDKTVEFLLPILKH